MCEALTDTAPIIRKHPAEQPSKQRSWLNQLNVPGHTLSTLEARRPSSLLLQARLVDDKVGYHDSMVRCEVDQMAICYPLGIQVELLVGRYQVYRTSRFPSTMAELVLNL